MDRATFFKHFDLLADRPNAVAKMRQLILELAVRGLFVSQDSNDKSAIELLERSAEQQKRLVKEGTARAYEAPLVEDSEKFIRTTPKGWVWARLKQLGYFCVGATPSMNKSVYWGDGIPWVTPKDMRPLRIRGSEMSVTPLALKETRLRLLPKNSVLIVGRSGILKRLLPVAVTDIECVVNQDMKVLVPFLPELATFIQLMLRGHQAFILERLVKGGMTVQSLKYEEFEAQPFPLPPLAEQRRIVAKVDELMALCDELAARQQCRHDAAVQFQRSALHHLTTARDQKSFTVCWQRVCEHFNQLHDSPDAITQLRQAILQLAVQGQLVAQNPKDEREELKFGRDEELNTNAPFKIPEQWAWTRLSQLAEINGGFAFKSTDYTNEGTRVVRISDFDEFGFKDHKIVRHPFSPDLQKFMLDEFNILMAMTGGTVGKSYFVRSLQEPMVVNQRVATIKVSATVNPSYVDIAIRSEMTQEVIRKAKNSTNDNISMWDIKGFAIPLPPLAEQKRIVARVDELMQQCDVLEAQLTESSTLGTHLLDSTIYHLFTGNPAGTELAVSLGRSNK